MPEGTTFRWVVFGVVVAILFALDLFVHRKGDADEGEGQRSALIWTTIWIVAGLGFSIYVWLAYDSRMAQEYLAAYLIEKSLSVDNLFVFLVVFESLNIPRRHQRRVLWWGILGALGFRALLIFVGVAAIERWSWIEIVFGGILLITAYRVFREDPAKKEENRAVKWLSRHLPIEEEARTRHFFVRREGRWRATPLLIALLAIEFTDLVFAVDSVPAAFSVTHSRFVLYSSNVFAILGLRALYIVLAGAIRQLQYLHYGLAAVLALAGIKLIISRWVEISPLWATGVVVLVLAASVGASVYARRRKQ